MHKYTYIQTICKYIYVYKHTLKVQNLKNAVLSRASYNFKVCFPTFWKHISLSRNNQLLTVYQASFQIFPVSIFTHVSIEHELGMPLTQLVKCVPCLCETYAQFCTPEIPSLERYWVFRSFTATSAVRSQPAVIMWGPVSKRFKKIRHMACVYMMLCNMLFPWLFCFSMILLGYQHSFFQLASIQQYQNLFSHSIDEHACRDFTSISLLLKLLCIIIMYIYYTYLNINPQEGATLQIPRQGVIKSRTRWSSKPKCCHLQEFSWLLTKGHHSWTCWLLISPLWTEGLRRVLGPSPEYPATLCKLL